MSEGFQPEKPYPHDQRGSQRLTSFWVALLSALGVTMILAILAPRFFVQESQTGWMMALGAGALVFIVVFAIGRVKGAKSDQPMWSGEDDGEK